jgi:hypothetical protein
VAIRRQDAPVDTILPPLTDAGDAIAGGGAVLDGTPMGGAPQSGPREVVLATDQGLVRIGIAPLLAVVASDVEVAGLHFDRVVAFDVVVVGGPAPGVEHVIVRDNVFTGLGRDVPGGGVSIVAGADDPEPARRRVGEGQPDGQRPVPDHAPRGLGGGERLREWEHGRGHPRRREHDRARDRGHHRRAPRRNRAAW